VAGDWAREPALVVGEAAPREPRREALTGVRTGVVGIAISWHVGSAYSAQPA
jgi:hypothetical protein